MKMASRRPLPLPIREKGSALCPFHKGKETVYFCKEVACDGELICSKCLQTRHKGHKVSSLDDLIAIRQRKKIQTFVNQAEKIEQQKIKAEMRYVESILDEKRKLFPNVIYQIRQHNAKLKEEVDKTTNEFIKTVEKLETETMDLLHKYKKELVTMYAKITSLLHDCNKAMRVGSNVQVYDTERDIHGAFNLPYFPSLRVPVFQPLNYPEELIETAFGTIRIKDDTEDPTAPSETGDELAMAEVQSEDQSADAQSIRSTLYEEIQTLSEFNYPYEISKICPISDHAWVSHWEGKRLLLLNQDGEVKQQLRLSVEVWDIAKSPKTNNLWMCSRDDNSVRELTTTLAKEPRVRFKCSREPWCLCCTTDNKVLIGMTKEIRLYNLQGKVTHAATIDREGERIVVTPRSITQCRITRNVAVADFDWEEDDGKGKPRVAVMDNQLNLLFYYRRKTKKLPEDSLLKPTPFEPWSLSYDSKGDLVIADFNNDSIMLVSGEGSLLKTLLVDWTNSPVAVGLQSDNILWSIFNYEDVKVLKYEDTGVFI